VQFQCLQYLVFSTTKYFQKLYLIKYRRIKLLDNASLEGLQAFTGKGTLAFLLTGFVLAFTLTSTQVV
jgi:hypothetical protein